MENRKHRITQDMKTLIPTYNENWEDVAGLAYDMYLEGRKWDVSFLVSNKYGDIRVFSCHRCVMAYHSEVFAAMLYGFFVTDDKSHISIEYCHTSAFKVMIQKFYTGLLDVSSVEQAFEFLVVAKRFIALDFIESLLTYIWRNIAPENVWICIEYSLVHEESAIEDTAWQVFRRDTAACLKLPSFKLVSRDTLEKAVQMNYYNKVNEHDLFEAALQWAIYNLSHYELEYSVHNIRYMLATVLPFINVTYISKQEYNKLAPSALSQDDMNCVLESEGKMLYLSLDLYPRRQIDKSSEFLLVYGTSDDPRQPIDIKIRNTSSVFVNCHFSLNANDRVTAIIVPAQRIAATNTAYFYTENMTILFINARNNAIVLRYNYAAHFIANTSNPIPIIGFPTCTSPQSFFVKIIFHKNGVYTTRDNHLLMNPTLIVKLFGNLSDLILNATYRINREEFTDFQFIVSVLVTHSV